MVMVAFGRIDVVHETDEFGDSNGKSRLNLYSEDINGTFMFQPSTGIYSYILLEYTGMFDKGDVIDIRIKNDLDEVISINATIKMQTLEGTGYLIYNSDADKLIDFIKKSNTIRVVVRDYNNRAIMKTISCAGFTVKYNDYINNL